MKLHFQYRQYLHQTHCKVPMMFQPAVYQDCHLLQQHRWPYHEPITHHCYANQFSNADQPNPVCRFSAFENIREYQVPNKLAYHEGFADLTRPQHPDESLMYRNYLQNRPKEQSKPLIGHSKHKTDIKQISPKSCESEIRNDIASPTLSTQHEDFDASKAFACPQCKYTTDRKNNLKRHIVTMHYDCDRKLECCGNNFHSKAKLREHVTLFHKHGYRCSICGRIFCRKALLRRHMTVHNGKKDFHCMICNYATSHKSNLERHQKVHSKLFAPVTNTRLIRENRHNSEKVSNHKRSANDVHEILNTLASNTHQPHEQRETETMLDNRGKVMNEMDTIKIDGVKKQNTANLFSEEMVSFHLQNNHRTCVKGHNEDYNTILKGNAYPISLNKGEVNNNHNHEIYHEIEETMPGMNVTDINKNIQVQNTRDDANANTDKCDKDIRHPRECDLSETNSSKDCSSNLNRSNKYLIKRNTNQKDSSRLCRHPYRCQVCRLKFESQTCFLLHACDKMEVLPINELQWSLVAIIVKKDRQSEMSERAIDLLY